MMVTMPSSMGSSGKDKYMHVSKFVELCVSSLLIVSPYGW